MTWLQKLLGLLKPQPAGAKPGLLDWFTALGNAWHSAAPVASVAPSPISSTPAQAVPAAAPATAPASPGVVDEIASGGEALASLLDQLARK